MTGGSIVNAALEEIGVIRPGQTPAPQESAVGLAWLNSMIDNWSTERLLLPFVTAMLYVMKAGGQQFYTVGLAPPPPAAQPDFPTPRPLRIDSSQFIQQSLNGTVVSFASPVSLITETEYQAIVDKGASSDVVEKLYFEPSLPWGKLYVWPVPNVASNSGLQANVWIPLTSFPDLVTDIPLAYGYDMAIKKNLAVVLASQFPAVQLNQLTLAGAAQGIARIQKLNALMVPGTPDIAVPPSPPDSESQYQPVPSTLAAEAQAKFGTGASK